jgi:hypothetical protein
VDCADSSGDQAIERDIRSLGLIPVDNRMIRERTWYLRLNNVRIMAKRAARRLLFDQLVRQRRFEDYLLGKLTGEELLLLPPVSDDDRARLEEEEDVEQDPGFQTLIEQQLRLAFGAVQESDILHDGSDDGRDGAPEASAVLEGEADAVQGHNENEPPLRDQGKKAPYDQKM